MRIYMIIPEAKTIFEDNISEKDTLDAIQKRIGCRCIAIAGTLENGDTVFVDDEGLLNDEPKHFFAVRGVTHQPFCGRGLIVAHDDEGDCIDAQSTLVELNEIIAFPTQEECLRGTWYKWLVVGLVLSSSICTECNESKLTSEVTVYRPDFIVCDDCAKKTADDWEKDKKALREMGHQIPCETIKRETER